MRALSWTGLLVLLLGLGGCKSGGGNTPDPLAVFVAAPTTLAAGADAIWAAAWENASGAVQITWDFGGGGNPDDIGPAPATNPDVRVVEMVNPSNTDPADYTATVTVADAGGQTATRSVNYTVPPGSSTAPVINSITGADTTTLTVNVSDVDGDDITVTATPPAGFSVAPPAGTVSGGGPGDVVFNFTANDLFGGGSGTATFTADDGNGGTNTQTANVLAPPIGPSLADTLFAIPLHTTATTADQVVIVVATGVTAQPFRYLNGCRVTAPSDWAYVANSFNVGVPGGAAGDTDGFWTDMNPSGGFLLPPDSFLTEKDLGGGRSGIDFNVTPIGGSDVTTSGGALFNFAVTFGVAGVYDLGFQEASGVNRTYYSNGDGSIEQIWGDISNNHAGVPNTVTVN